MREVTFQSMLLMSSPNWYSRTSENSMPRPLKTEWYSPASDSFTRRLVRISMRRTFFRRSAGSMAQEFTGAARAGAFLGHLDGVEHPLDDLLGRDVLGLGFVRQDDPVAHDVEGDRLDVLGRHVSAAPDEGVRLRGQGQEHRRAGRRPELDQTLDVELVVLRPASREHDLHDVVLDAAVDIDLAHHRARPQDVGGRDDSAHVEVIGTGHPVE